MPASSNTASPAPANHDTSMCDHLRDLIEGADIKPEPDAPQDGDSRHLIKSGVERRFEEVVRWGALPQGVKRRKTGGDCFKTHFETSSGRCSFAVDPFSGTTYCLACSDTTYPDHFETLYRRTRLQVEEDHDTSREAKGRGRATYKGWDRGFQGLVENGGVRSSCRGLRPLLNLSQTCFLSAILQAFIHNPLLKAYFLGDKHNRHVCTSGSRGLATGRPHLAVEPGGAPGPEREKGCMCCEMDRAFEEFHSEDKAPYGPVTMLYSMWHASAELEGYGQQDAHSFFLAALDQMHAHAKGQLSSCNCIAHQTFAGSLLSAVTCGSCHTTSTTVDPILDIQLDFPSAPPTNRVLTLASLLRRFCAEEKVGDYGKGYDCSSCGGGHGITANRRLLVKRLPQVLSFQLKLFKRFAHNATSTKVELPIRFPSNLDMRPYTEGDDQDALPSSLYLYDLYAVVTHEGKLDNGHYWADVLCGEEWWHCDDDKVTRTTLSSVLSQRAYMLFYVKRTLAYAQPPIPRLSISVPLPAQSGKTDTEAGRTGGNSVEDKSSAAKTAPAALGHGVAEKGKAGETVTSPDQSSNSGVGGGSGHTGHPIRGMEM